MKFEAVASREVLRKCGLADMDTELCIQRCQWYRSIARDRDNHVLVLAALFGTLHDREELDNHVWLRQIRADIERISSIEGCEHLSDTHPKTLFYDSEVLDTLNLVDFAQLRAAFNSVHIAPMDYVPVAMQVNDELETVHRFQCKQVINGISCDACFETLHSLLLHQQRRNDHLTPIHISRCVLTNACPWCASVFSSKVAACHHVRGAFLHDRCIADAGYLATEHVELDNSGLLSLFCQMDLGLAVSPSSQPSQPNKRARSDKATLDMAKVLTLVTKLSLNSAQQMRAMRAILLDVYHVPAEHEVVTMGKAATQAFAEKAKGISPQEKDAQLGLPHVHLWNSILTVLKKHLAGPEAENLNKYLQDYQPKGWKAVAAEVTHIKISKCYDKSFMKLEVHVKESTPQQMCLRPLQALVLGPAGSQGAPRTGSARRHRASSSGVHRQFVNPRRAHMHSCMDFLTLPELQARCRDRRLSTTGTKAALIERLLDHALQ